MTDIIQQLLGSKGMVAKILRAMKDESNFRAGAARATWTRENTFRGIMSFPISERVHYRTEPWSTREYNRKGQLVQPRPWIKFGYEGNQNDWSDEALK